jgi:enolase-phosphatase E1
MIQAVVSDIEGTTSSIAFVHDVLFPYAREHLPAFVSSHRDEPELIRILQDVATQAGHRLSTDEAVAQLLQWIDEDRKITPLKALQGLIWENGYRSGDFFGHVYPDTVDTFRNWRARGIRLYIYSSGSVRAQQLLFGHTRYGDLTPLFSGYFDTRVGGKTEAQSYAAIREQLALEAGAILFCSDIVAELDAARSAGMQTCWFLRDAATLPDSTHPVVRSFDDLGNLQNFDSD